MKIRIRCVRFYAVLVSFLFAGFFTNLSYGEEIIKIGSMNVMSGSGATWGMPQVRGARLGCDVVNSKGVKVAGKTYKFKLIEYDDKYSGPEALSVINKLVFEDKVKYVIGSTGSVPNLAITPVINANKILHLAGSTAEIVKPENPYTFRLYVSDARLKPYLLRWVFRNRPQINRVAMVVQDTQSGRAIEPGAIQEINARGKTLTDKVYNDPGIKDWFPILTKLKANNPDLIFFSATTEGLVGAAIKQMRQLGMKAITLSAPINEVSNFFDIGGGAENVEGHISAGQFYPESKDPLIMEYQRKFKEKFGIESKGYGEASFYDGVLMLAYAMEKFQTLEPDKLVHGLKNISELRVVLGPALFGFKEINGNGQERLASLFAVVATNGKMVYHEVKWE